MNGTIISKCEKCKNHPFQDQKYGEKMRVFNVGGNKDAVKYYCTVCGKTKEKMK